MNPRQWMIENIGHFSDNERLEFLSECQNECGLSQRRVQELYKELFQPEHNTKYNNILENNNPELKGLYPGMFQDHKDEDIKEYAVKLAKSNQKQKDLNRIERKSFRENTRVENALTELSAELKKLLENNSFHSYTPVEKSSDESSPVGILQISDLHLNELIDITGNLYNYEEASRRLMKLAEKAYRYFSSNNISNIVIAMTGDILNSDRRLDEMLSQAANRTKACFMAVDLIKQFIEDLADDFDITVLCVTGNESRIKDEMGFSDALITDNYDYIVFNMLKYVFSDWENEINFIEGDPYELVVKIKDKNILFTHGYNIKDKCEDTIGKIKGRYASKGIVIDYVIFGHMHSCRIGDTFARSGSLCGANAYSERGLNLASRASQNIYIVDDFVDGIKIDLQDVDEDLPGYDIYKSLEAYNVKSDKKLKDNTTVLSIVV